MRAKPNFCIKIWWSWNYLTYRCYHGEVKFGEWVNFGPTKSKKRGVSAKQVYLSCNCLSVLFPIGNVQEKFVVVRTPLFRRKSSSSVHMKIFCWAIAIPPHVCFQARLHDQTSFERIPSFWFCFPPENTFNQPRAELRVYKRLPFLFTYGRDQSNFRGVSLAGCFCPVFIRRRNPRK